MECFIICQSARSPSKENSKLLLMQTCPMNPQIQNWNLRRRETGGRALAPFSAGQARAVGEYYVMPHANYAYEDETRVTINSKQLLSTGNVTTEDKTADIVGGLASIVSKAKGPFFAAEQKQKNRAPSYFSFRPSNYTEYHRVKSQLRLRDITFKLDRSHLLTRRALALLLQKENNSANRACLFRPAISYRITLKFDGVDLRNSNPVALIDRTQQFILPDPSRLHEIQYPRMAFVKKVREIGFYKWNVDETSIKKCPVRYLVFLGSPRQSFKRSCLFLVPLAQAAARRLLVRQAPRINL